MTYLPGSSGYPPAQQPPGPYGASTPSFGKPADGPTNLPLYLNVAVVLLGLATYLVSFGPIYELDSPLGDFSASGSLTSTAAALLAALLAGVGVLPKAKSYAPIVAVIAALGALLALSSVFQKPDQVSVGWGLWLVLAFTVVQAVVAAGALLLEADVVTAPTPKPKYDQFAPYGLPPGGYYGQPGGYPAYGGYQSGPSTGGFGAHSGPPTGGFSTGPQHGQPGPQPGQPGQHQSPPTPPTGFPSFGQPPASGQGPGSGGAGGSGQGQQSPSSAPSGPPQS
jgi:hypothetical protein